MHPKILLAALALSPGLASLADGALITLNFQTPMGAAEQQAFNDAAAYWNSAIIGYDLVSDINGNPTPHSLVIDASINAIDGAGGILGSASPTQATYYDNNPVGPPTIALYYASAGAMQFDSADTASLVASNTFYGVVLHEMAHVLGIGTLWDFNTINGTGVNLYTVGSGQYLGANALAGWQTEFNQPGATFVPVELGGGAGTADAHWNEVDGGGGATGFVSNLTGLDFSNELMTGWSSSTFFVSTVTLGSLDDLGYIVDYSKAGIAVPEVSGLLLSLVALPLLLKRRRA